MSLSKEPLVAAAGLLGEWSDAMVAAEVSALATLKAEMQGLAVLFGGEAAPKTDAERLAEDAGEEASFDNMPV